MLNEPLLLQPMRDEVTRLGVRELRTASEVETFMGDGKGTRLVFINSVCGCAAGNARPALRLVLESMHDQRPDLLGTVFAGQDTEATERFRACLPGVPPSSPAVYLLKDGHLVAHIPREHIEGRSAQDVASDLSGAIVKHC
jgi:putative YphP/YqiW family bacilliredoxin